MLFALSLAVTAPGKDKHSRSSLTPLADYIESYGRLPLRGIGPSGSLFRPSSALANLNTDPRAQHIDDLITIRIVEDTLAQSSADVSAARQLQAQSGISALAGKINTSGIDSLFSPQSSQSLTGKGQANSQTRLRTSVGGRIAAVLANGVMVVEAKRSVRMNNETQTILLRAMVRPEDVSSDNTVLSTALANLEIELKGKGVVSDATRPPNRLVRALLWLAGF